MENTTDQETYLQMLEDYTIGLFLILSLLMGFWFGLFSWNPFIAGFGWGLADAVICGVNLIYIEQNYKLLNWLPQEFKTNENTQTE